MARIEKEKRLRVLVAELKKNRYPNSTSMLKIFKRMDESNEAAVNISSRTFSRDIETLKTKYNAPIEFDGTLNGYYLTKPGWSLETIVQDDENLEAEVLANKLAKDISPLSLANEFDKAVVDRLTKAGTLFSNQSVDNFFSADTVVVNIDKEVMTTIYRGWKLTQAVEILYKRPDGSTCKRLIEPYVVSCSDRIWYVKGFCHNRKEIRIFALHRILDAKLVDFYFAPEVSVGRQNLRENFFDYPTLKNAKLWCSSALASYVREQADARGFSIEEVEDGAIIFNLPPQNEDDLIRWILGEGKNIKVISPQHLKEQVILKLKETLEFYQH